MNILVGMSGGVDSSTVAALLQAQGHQVTGVTMSLWRDDNPYEGGTKDACYGPGEKADIEAARQVCAALGIPFYVFDCAREYERRVIDYFRSAGGDTSKARVLTDEVSKTFQITDGTTCISCDAAGNCTDCTGKQ